MIEYIGISIAEQFYRINFECYCEIKWIPAVSLIFRNNLMSGEECEVWLSQFWDRANKSRFKIPIYLILHPKLTMQAVRCILCLPFFVSKLSSDRQGRLIYKSLKQVGLFKVFSIAESGACVLQIPLVPQDYSLGSSKQTLRRKVRAAKNAGVSCRIVEDLQERKKLVVILERALSIKSNPIYRVRGRDYSYLIESGLWTVAFAHSGEPLVIAVIPQDGTWALLQCFVSLGETDQHSDARYLLTQAVVEQLARSGVRFLVDNRSPSQLSNGLRHFQRMLGFRIARIKLVQDNRSTPLDLPHQIGPC